MRLLVPAVAVLALLATAAVLVLPGRGEADRDPGSGPADLARVDVGVITAVPDRWFRENVAVTGEVAPVDDERFVLVGEDGETIVVVPRPNAVRGALQAGERVTVTGTVFGFGRLQVAELDRLLQGDAPAALRTAPTDLEDVYLQALTVAPT